MNNNSLAHTRVHGNRLFSIHTFSLILPKKLGEVGTKFDVDGLWTNFWNR